MIWNRISPLRSPLVTACQSVWCAFSEHLDVFAVASNGRTMSNWWDQARVGRVGFMSKAVSLPLAVLAPRDCGRSLRRPRPVHELARTTAFTVLVGRRQRMAWVVPIGNLQCRPGSTVSVVCRYSDHIDLFTTAWMAGSCHLVGY